MIGTPIAGWTVREVLFEAGDVRRYGVVAPDGRTGTLEIAAVGTAQATAFVDRVRGLAPHDVLDRGIDSFGNPYVVLPIAYAPYAPYAPYPPPAPMFAHERPLQPPVVARIAAAPSHDARRRRRIWIGVGVAAAALVALNVAIRVGKNKDKNAGEPSSHDSIRVYADGHWDRFSCEPTFKLSIRTSTLATIEVDGTREETDTSGHLEMKLTPDRLAGRTSIVVHASNKNEDTGETTVAIPPRAKNDGVPRSVHMYGEASFSKKTATLGGSPLELTSEYGNKTPDNHIEFALETCNLKPGKPQPAVTTTRAERMLRVDVDLLAMAMAMPGNQPQDKLSLAVDLVDDHGAPTTLAIEIPDFHGFRFLKGAYARFAAVATQPLADAPLPADAPRPRPLLVAHGADSIDRTHLGAATPAQAVYIALFEYKSTDAGMCGPYRSYRGTHYASRTRETATVKIYEARSGKLMTQRSFGGSTPSCPSSISVYNGRADSISGGAPTTQISSWLDAFRK